jgi:hypothetical protein
MAKEYGNFPASSEGLVSLLAWGIGAFQLVSIFLKWMVHNITVELIVCGGIAHLAEVSLH